MSRLILLNIHCLCQLVARVNIIVKSLKEVLDRRIYLTAGLLLFSDGLVVLVLRSCVAIIIFAQGSNRGELFRRHDRL